MAMAYVGRELHSSYLHYFPDWKRSRGRCSLDYYRKPQAYMWLFLVGQVVTLQTISVGKGSLRPLHMCHSHDPNQALYMTVLRRTHNSCLIVDPEPNLYMLQGMCKMQGF